MILVGNKITNINHIKPALYQLFNIKDLGNLKYFLGFAIATSQTCFYPNGPRPQARH